MTGSGTNHGLAANRPVSPRRYTGRELEAMAFAVNYHRWILDLFAPHLGRRVLEVGAGTGAFSEVLLDAGVEHLLALEPSENMFPFLERTVARGIRTGRAEARRQTLSELAAELAADPAAPSPDTVIYLNVLEHIEDDCGELRKVRSLLPGGGHLLIFVPAHEWLMSRIDRQFGHHRRYSLTRLAEVCRAAGFQIVAHRHFDLLGILPWWVRYRVLGSIAMEPSAVRLYDRWMVPLARAVESRVSPPIGKNILMICRASSAGEPAGVQAR
jgi:SAM-dependent methyltransferase